MAQTARTDSEAIQTASGTVHRAVRLMTVISESDRPLGVTEISGRMLLPVSTVHRLLNLLREEGIVSHDEEDRTYYVGAEFYRISSNVLSAVPVAKIGQKHITALSAHIDETVILGLHLPERHAMAFVARADGSHPLQYRIPLNVPMPLVWGASGKSILAYLPEDKVRETLAHAQPAATTGAAPPALPTLMKELRKVRERGYVATFNEKSLGAYGLAAPFFGAHGILGCVCITAPKERGKKYDNPRTITKLLDCAATITDELGGDPPD